MNVKELFGYWLDVRNGLLAALDKLMDDQLDFRPREGLWSLRETIVHIERTFSNRSTVCRKRRDSPGTSLFATLGGEGDDGLGGLACTRA